MLKKMCHNYSYANNEITKFDENRWKQVSMMERVFYEMPSTTNSLESSHGHLNCKTPRRNNIWAALNRIITFLINQNYNYQHKINHNSLERNSF